ncbi:MAG: exonuclease SbcCD subunit D C-terminal domain-containing protein [Candidatus Delongbacteria bacterium]
MRVIHTSDWHLGQTLRGFDRTREHQVFLDWLLLTLVESAADALLIAGDIFDQANPSAEAQAQFYHFLADARRRLPRLDVVAIAGNHDSPGRLEAPRRLLKDFGIHVAGHCNLQNDLSGTPGDAVLDRLLAPLRDAGGEIAAWVLTVPFLRPGDLRDGSGLGYQDALRAVYRRLADAALERCRNGEALLAMGHLHVQGGIVSELSERRLIIGGEEAVDAGVFPAEAAYVALGHLHRPQAVAGRPDIRYAGSPLPLSFPEEEHSHHVLQVDLDGGTAVTTPLPTPRAVELLRLPAEPLPLEQVLQELAAYPFTPSARGIWPLLEVRIREAILPVQFRQRLEEVLDGKSVHLARIDRSKPALPAPVTGGAPSAPEGPDVRRLDPAQVFARRLDDEGELPDRAELEGAFAELLDQALQTQGGRA